MSTNNVNNNSFSSISSSNNSTNTYDNCNRNRNKSFIDAFDKFNTNCTENMITKKLSSSTKTCSDRDRRTDWSNNKSKTCTIHQQQQNDSTFSLMTHDTSNSSSMSSNSSISSRSILSSNNYDDTRDSNDDSWTVATLFTSTGRPNQYVGGYSPEWIAIQRRSYNIR